MMGLKMGSGARLILCDFILSFMWVWCGALIKVFVYRVLQMGHDPIGEVFKSAIYVANMFMFAFLGKISKGGAYNPLNLLASAVSGDFPHFLFTVGARIPAQVLGSITGVRYFLQNFLAVGYGPSLNVDIHRGALTEGLLTFVIVILSLALTRKSPGGFFMKTWITSISKLALHILGSDLTGGCMNPASVVGWAYARGDHITKEHILVYWLAPVEATLLAVWMFKLFARLLKVEERENIKDKSD